MKKIIAIATAILLVILLLWVYLNINLEKLYKAANNSVDKLSIEIGEDTVGLKEYSTADGAYSFSYQAKLFLLDRVSEDNKIYISPREINFNDFTGGYSAPIEIIFDDVSDTNEMIKAIENKKIHETIVGNKVAKIISGTVPERKPYYAFDVYAIFLPTEKISIVGANVNTVDGVDNLKRIVDQIANSLKSLDAR